MSDRSLYLTDANGTLYLAEPAALVGEYRLTIQHPDVLPAEVAEEPTAETPKVVDLMAALEASLAAVKEGRP